MKDKPVILIVDDEPQFIKLLEAYLVPQGYEIVKAASGEEALEKLSSNQIDLILLDVVMPGMDGFEVTRRIRRDTVHRMIPIILITALQETEDRVKGIEAGCDDFLSKPFDKMELFARVHSLLQVKAYNDLMNDYQIELEAMVTSRTEELRHSLEDLQQEITERKRTEQELREKERLLKGIIDGVSDVLCIQYPDYSIERYNKAGYDLLGMTPEEVQGKKCFEFLGRDRECAECSTRKALKSGKIEQLEKYVPELGIYFDCRSNPILDEDGNVVRIIEHLRDITDRKRAAEEASRMVTVVRDSNDAITIQDSEGRITAWNRGAELMYGYTEAEALQMSIERLTASGKVQEQKDFVRRLLAGEAITSLETRRVTKDGRVLDVWMTVTKLVDDSGESIGIASTERDITGRKRGEESLRKLNAELEQRVEERTQELVLTQQVAEQANQAKSVFLANMSHEIRTPLNAVLGFAQVLERDASLTPRQTGMLHTIMRSGQHLLNLINDILDMSKIEAGRLELSPRDFSLYDLLDDLKMMFHPSTVAKQLSLSVERHSSVPHYVNADESKLRQVVINLLGNAVKFTKTGGVAVRVRGETAAGSSAGDANAVRLVVEVEDSGPGIATEELDRIFEPFRQSAANKEAGGTGLGLALSQNLVKLMDGSLTVKSRVGKGSCFRFDVLVTPVEGAAQEKEQRARQVIGLEPGAGPFRILIVDDQKDNRDLLAALLEPLDFEIREAVNGQEALDVFEAWSPHTVLMDIVMPVMDGYEATRRIKATEQGRTTPVIAVTASVFGEAEKEVLARGVDGYVHKPFRTEELFAVLRKCLGLRYVYAEGAGQASEKSGVQPLTREDLAALPEELCQAMRQAVDEGDMAGLQALIAQVEETDAETARKLRNLADRYDYETLTQVLIKQEEGEPDE
ncbi:MAG: response regulator [Deltaproteobacteria bacterium]|nr:response regulator [Deltaproteobacteria bacterium]